MRHRGVFLSGFLLAALAIAPGVGRAATQTCIEGNKINLRASYGLNVGASIRIKGVSASDAYFVFARAVLYQSKSGKFVWLSCDYVFKRKDNHQYLTTLNDFHVGNSKLGISNKCKPRFPANWTTYTDSRGEIMKTCIKENRGLCELAC
ncbi:MAG: hypothetical protein A3J27_14685 [Candidatus Tectomicrobia bacterium RIFCSPLOWO2_12_FULL_69_37]|nr:MAG: hypothetical protein A3J27_14685 [Candidatus Tectomicrobia bacterium RIFCSPLOWO2_12_FULL_69_37]